MTSSKGRAVGDGAEDAPAEGGKLRRGESSGSSLGLLQMDDDGFFGGESDEDTEPRHGLVYELKASAASMKYRHLKKLHVVGVSAAWLGCLLLCNAMCHAMCHGLNHALHCAYYNVLYCLLRHVWYHV